MANEHYGSFIKEAFVAPIRSVLIVDDDYPTFDEMLQLEIDHQGEDRPPRTDKTWYDTPQRIKNVIENFRRPDRSLLVDIHDGSNVDAKGEMKIASHLHQSDLLVLDYQLDKTRPHDGARAIEILRRLMINEHFNLVVVHTTEKLDIAYQEITLGLLSPSGDTLSQEEQDEVAAMIAEREDQDPNVLASLREAVGVSQYIHSRLHILNFMRTMGQGNQPYSHFAAISEEANWNNGKRRLLLRHLLQQIEEPLLPRLHGSEAGPIKVSSSATKWIKAESVFIAFSDKQDEDDPVNALQEALEAWNPAPSRLFMAKLRAEMDEHGVVAQTGALERQHALAHWYARLLRAGGNERRWLIAESVARHSDQLMNVILRRVEKFATALIEKEAEAAEGQVDARCQQHFNVDLTGPLSKKKAEREHNAFVCSTAPQGWHLSTGHVFEMEKEHWVCLSPACDLVPGQGQARTDDYGGRLPFVAVKLYPQGDKEIADVNSNLFVFLTIAGNVQAYCFNSHAKEATAPTWKIFYAENGGILSDDFRFDVSVMRAGKTRLLSCKQPATVVAQLRYEYALNLAQKLGTSMTRIGLDFVGTSVATIP